MGAMHGEPRIENFQTQGTGPGFARLTREKSHSASDGESGDRGQAASEAVCAAPDHTSGSIRWRRIGGQDAHSEAAQAILSQIDQIYADCQAKGKRWGDRKRLVRFAGKRERTGKSQSRIR